MRKAIIAGNWKMNNTVDESLILIDELKEKVKDAKCEVVVCPTFISLVPVINALKGSNIKVGAQNMHFEEKGAFTGEISPNMLKSIGVEYVILGHSERRQFFKETDEELNKKLKAAFNHGLIPILCVGESLKEREENITEKIVKDQLEKDLKEIDRELVKNMVIAYEPIWAIGTGKTATDEQANETITYIRNVIENLYDKDTAEQIRIQYGGSVKPSTIKGQMAKDNIDGALVGGASLIASDFASIVNYDK